MLRTNTTPLYLTHIYFPAHTCVLLGNPENKKGSNTVHRFPPLSRTPFPHLEKRKHAKGHKCHFSLIFMGKKKKKKNAEEEEYGTD